MAAPYPLPIWTTKAQVWVEKAKGLTVKDQMMKVIPRAAQERQKTSVDPRMMSMAETSSANIAIRRILAIPLYTHIWSKNTQKDLMAKLGLHQLVEEAVEDPEKM